MIQPDTQLLHCSTSLHLFPCDSTNDEIFMQEKAGCFLKILNAEREIFQLETPTHLVLGIGNVMNSIEYTETLLRLLGSIEKQDRLPIMRWLDDVFRKYKFQQTPLLMEIHGVTRLSMNLNRYWTLTFPDSTCEKGFGNPYLFAQKHESTLKDYYGGIFNDFLENKFKALYDKSK
ncbi:MAG: hypothetical protein ACLQQ4_14505 [Bacteroidia bacterium]